VQWKPNVTVSAVVVRDGRFLLVEEKVDGRIVFNQPAGHLEQNETFLDAIRREVIEETAWQFEPESLVGVYLYPDPHADVTYLRFCFHGTCTHRLSDRPLDKEILRAVWMSRSDIEANAERLRSPMVLKCIDDYLSGRSYPLDLLNHFCRGR